MLGFLATLFLASLPAASAAVAAGTVVARNGLQISAKQRSLEKAWSKDLDKSSKAPVKRVIELLGKMKAELEAEADNESEMYDKMVCWCETSEKEKTQAIKVADAAELELQAEIETRSAKSGELSTEIDAMKKQIAEDSEASKTATALREKEAAEFRATEKDYVQTITNLKNAIAVLSRHQDPSLVQLSALRVVIRDAAMKHEIMKAGAAPRTAFIALGSSSSRGNEKRKAGDAEDSSGQSLLNLLDTHGLISSGSEAEDALPLRFAERVLMKESKAAALAPRASFLQAATDTQVKQPLFKSYSTRSDSIVGVLNQMLEEFEAELKSSQKEEATASENAAALAATKAEQIALGKEKLDEMEAEHANNNKALSDAKENIEATRNQRSADVEFLQNLKLTCNDLDAQWEKRSKTRSAELLAVTETVAILTEDDNHEQLVKGSVSMLQIGQRASSSAQLRLRSKAARALRRAARSPEFDADDLLVAWRGRKNAVGASTGPRAQLSTLAMTVQLDSFEKVKAMMDKLVTDLKKQQEEEVAFKAYCTKELNENEKAEQAKTVEKEDLEAKISQLESLLKKLAAEISEAEKQIAETETEVKQAGETREKENSEFQTTVADQRATQEILKKALARLEDFYKKGLGKAVLLQRVEQTPPAQFNTYKTNSGASPVIGLLEQIIEDSKALEADATTTEAKAQSDYELMVKDSTELIAKLSESITTKKKASSAAQAEMGEAKSGLVSTEGELESLAAYEADLHQQCDFVLKNFEIRQKARLQEMEAIQAAKGILSGSASA